MIVIAVSGYSNSGKTTLVEMLIKEFLSMGFKVLAVKHGKKFDVEGKDSWRMWNAGAEVAMIGEGFTALMLRRELSLEELGKIVKADIVIAEGFKSENVRKIVIGNVPCEGEVIERLNERDVVEGRVDVKELVRKILDIRKVNISNPSVKK